MELALITPVNYLNYTTLLPGRFCVANVAADNDKYANFFSNASAEGYNVIMDNGVFENDLLDDKALIALADELRPKVIIAPDIIGGNANDNWVRACDFADLCKQFLPEDYKYELMYSAQSCTKDPKAFENVLEAVIADDRFKWIGINRDGCKNAYGSYTNTHDQEINRLHFVHRAVQTGMVIRAMEAGKKWHFLGIGDHIHLIEHYWFVDSMDTASFFYQGTLGQPVVNGVLPSVLKRPNDYFHRNHNVTEEVREVIIHNCVEAQKYADKAAKLRRALTTGRV